MVMLFSFSVTGMSNLENKGLFGNGAYLQLIAQELILAYLDKCLCIRLENGRPYLQVQNSINWVKLLIC